MANLEFGSQQSRSGGDSPAMEFEKDGDSGHHGRCKTGSPPLQTQLSQQVSHNVHMQPTRECEAKILLSDFFGNICLGYYCIVIIVFLLL